MTPRANADTLSLAIEFEVQPVAHYESNSGRGPTGGVMRSSPRPFCPSRPSCPTIRAVSQLAARRPYLAFAALAVLLAVSLAYRIRDSADRIDELRHGDTIARLPFDFDLPQLTIGSLQPEAVRESLREGDTLRSAGGRPLTGVNQLLGPLREARAGDQLDVELDSISPAEPSRKSVSITLQPMRTGPPTLQDWLLFTIVSTAMPYLCMALGFWVAFVRIRDGRAWLLLIMLLGLANFSGGIWRSLFGRGDAFQWIAAIYQPVLANLLATLLMLFAIYFPDRLEFDRRHPWAKWMVIAPILIRAMGTNVAQDLATLNNLPLAVEIDGLAAWSRTPVQILQLAAVLLFFAIMIYRTRTASSPDARRRLLLLDAAALVSFTPVVMFIVLQSLDLVQFSEWLRLPLLGAMFVFPVTMAYVILVERAMDVRVVVRLGLQYLLARGSVRAAQVALSVFVILAIATMSVATRPLLRVILISAALGVVFAIQAYTDVLRRWIDKRFFREAYDAEHVLSELASSVRTMLEIGPLLETVTRRVSETLHVPRVAILLSEGGLLQPAYAIGPSPASAVPLPAEGLTDKTERDLQSALDAELLLPLSSNQKLVGAMSLGPKQSEEPYSSTDVRLLNAVATQTGLALQNSRLTAEIAAETARREKARRELEIAREVQERLFPQEYPPVLGLDYAGACRPALGVGGDYYDFVWRSHTEIGIAIGDVSGKGIPAALLMATLRAYLRGQTMGGEKDLAGMMSNLNELVYESSAANRYATFFYGRYDATTRRLNYVNAGHNPPLVFRPGAREVIRLEACGPVIGLIQSCQWTEACVSLQPGDLLVAFTDGISEAMNRNDEEWGEERLIETVGSFDTQPAQQMIDRIAAGADQFVAGAPQHDDMTLVVLRLVQ
jgi:phosphoserine phosphatase RsbU/P